MFKDLKSGDTLYIYNRSDVSMSVEQIVSVSAPRLDKGNMVVDVVVNNMTYTFKDTSETGYTANLAISPNKANILREVESQKASNETQIARVDQLKAELPKLSEIIDQLNPERREKKIMEDRLSKIEANLEKLLSNLKPMNNGGK